MMRPGLEFTGSKEEKSKYLPVVIGASNVSEASSLLSNNANASADHHHEVSGGTTTAAVFGIIKAMVGPAILYLPHAFADAGYLFAVVALWVCTFLYLFTANRLLTTWKYVRLSQLGRKPPPSGASSPVSIDHQEDGKSYMEYEMANLKAEGGENSPTTNTKITKRRSKPFSDAANTSDGDGIVEEVIIYDVTNENTGGKTSISYPKLARMAYGDVGESVVRTGITLMQLGVCLTYFIFVPHNLSTSIQKMLDIKLPFWVYLVAMVVVEIPLSSIRNVSKLVTTNVIATCLIAFGLAACLFLATEYYTAESSMVEGAAKAIMNDDDENQDLWDQEEYTVPALRHLSPWNDHWYLFIGTSVLLFEGSITLCLPLQEALEVPDAENRFPVLYNQTITSIVMFYTAFGYLCWSAFGDNISTVLTTSLPEGILATMVQLAYSIAVVFTFPLQSFPALDIIVQAYESYLQGDTDIVVQLDSGRRRVVVTIVMIILAIIAEVEMDNLGKVVSLMGSLLGCPLAFVFPPLIHSKLVPNANRKLDSIISALGVMAMIGATMITLYTWSEPGEERRLEESYLTSFFR